MRSLPLSAILASFFESFREPRRHQILARLPRVNKHTVWNNNNKQTNENCCDNDEQRSRWNTRFTGPSGRKCLESGWRKSDPQARRLYRVLRNSSGSRRRRRRRPPAAHSSSPATIHLVTVRAGSNKSGAPSSSSSATTVGFVFATTTSSSSTPLIRRYDPVTEEVSSQSVDDVTATNLIQQIENGNCRSAARGAVLEIHVSECKIGTMETSLRIRFAATLGTTRDSVGSQAHTRGLRRRG